MEQTWNRHVALAGRAVDVYWHLSCYPGRETGCPSAPPPAALFVAEEGCWAPLMWRVGQVRAGETCFPHLGLGLAGPFIAGLIGEAGDRHRRLQ